MLTPARIWRGISRLENPGPITLKAIGAKPAKWHSQWIPSKLNWRPTRVLLFANPNWPITSCFLVSKNEIGMTWWLDTIWFCIKSTFQLNFWENQVLVRSLASSWKDGASTDFSSQSCWRILGSLRVQATVKQVAKAKGKAFYCIKRRVLARYVDIDLILLYYVK